MEEKYRLTLLTKHLPLLDDLIPMQADGRVAVTLTGSVGDRVFARVGELHRALRSNHEGIAVGSCVIKRTFTNEEVEASELFLVKLPFTHLAAEDHGTEYQESDNCLQPAFTMDPLTTNKFVARPITVPCGICSNQASLLRVPFSKLESRKDIVQLWGGEVLVSERLAGIMQTGGFTGYRLSPILNGKTGKTPSFTPDNSLASSELLSRAAAEGLDPREESFWWWIYSKAPQALLNEVRLHEQSCAIVGTEGKAPKRKFYQLLVESSPLELAGQNSFGSDPYDTTTGGHISCESGEIAGIEPLSLLSLARASWDGSDLCRTRVFVSGRQGPFRPFQLLIISRRLLRAMQSGDTTGFTFETTTFSSEI